MRSKAIVSLGLLSLIVAACGGAATSPDQSSGSPGTTAEASVPAPDSSADVPVVRVAVSSFGGEQLDPIVEARGTTLSILIPMFDSLLEIAPDGGLQPGLAESWEMSEDGLSWTFQLRGDAEFHDGWGPVTASDVKFSVERFQDDLATSGASSSFRDNVREIEVPDDRTVVFHLNAVDIGFPYLVSPHESEGGVVFSEAYLTETAGDDVQAQIDLMNERPIGSGPFQFVERTPGDSLILEAVDNHWRVTPAVQRLEFLLVPEPATQVAMLQSDEVDIIELTSDQAAELEGGDFEVRTIERAIGATIQFPGTYRPPAEGMPTADPRVREALSLAINREELIASILGGQATLPAAPFNTTPATADIDAAHFADWASTDLRYDPDGARDLLADAGYADGFNGLKIFSFPRPGAGWLPQVNETVAAYWSEIGVDVEIVPSDYGALRPSLVQAERDDPLLAGHSTGWATSPRWTAQPVLAIYFSSGGATQLLEEPAFDEIVSEIPTELDDDARMDLVTEAWDMANDLWVMLPLFDANALFGVNDAVVGEWQVTPGYGFLGRAFETIEAP